MKDRVNIAELTGDFVVAYSGEGAMVYRFESIDAVLVHLRDPTMGVIEGFTIESFDEFLSDPDNWDFDDSDNPHCFRMDIGETTRMQLFCAVMRDEVSAEAVLAEQRRNQNQGGVKLVLHPGALERLVGNDSELRVQLTHAALENFAHAHLKALLNTTVWEETVAKERDFIRAEVAKLVKTLDKRPPQQVVTDASLSWLRSMIQERAVAAVDEVFTERVKAKADEYVKKAIDAVAFQVQAQLGFDIKKRVRDAVEQRLKGICETLETEEEKDKS